ncbi:MAG TPA: MMPL family transporter [Pirellulales bacterium]|nr:MMPL family transporter [Pirellulales bacterium]
MNRPQQLASAAKPTFYQRYSRAILATVLVVFPVLIFGANRAAQTNRNDVKDWLPATFSETKDYRWFQAHFENETQVLVSWQGATLDDPRVEKFARLVAPRSEQDQTPIDTSLFSSVLTGPELVRRLTDPPTNLPRSEAIKRLSGLLVGKDGKQTSAVVSLTQHAQDKLHYTLDELYRAAELATGLPRSEIYMGGPPVDNVAIDLEGQKTLRQLALFSALVGLGLSYWCMRQMYLTVLIIACAVYSAVISLSLVYFTGSSMDAILYTMPPVVYTASLSGAIHIINYYRNAVHDGGLAGAAERAVKRAWVPCTLSAGTTAIGLASLCTSELVPIRSFGFYASIGVMATLTLLFSCVPSALQLWPPRLAPPPPADPLEMSRHPKFLNRVGLRMAWGIVRHNGWVCVAFAVTLVGFGIGAWWIRTSVSIANLFSPDAEVVKHYDWLEQHLGGLVPTEVVLVFDNHTNKLSFLERLELVDRIQQHLQSLPEVSSTMSAATFTPPLPENESAAQTSRRTTGGAFGRLLMRNPEYVRRDVFNKQLAEHRREYELGDYLSHEKADGLDEDLWRISLRLVGSEDIDYGQFVHVIDREVQPYLDAEKEAKVDGISAVVTGVTPVVYKAERSLLEGLVESFFMAFVIMAAVMAVVYRSLPAGLLVMFPNVWPMALVFGILGYGGVVVDIGTMMTASVAMGVSVDDAAHYITWFRFGIAKGYDRRTAAIYAYRNAAVAMAQSSIIVGLGLSVFGLSSFVPTRMFGLLMLLLLSWGLFADLVLMPAILAGPLGRFFTHGIRRQPEQVPAEEKSLAAVDS